MKKFVLKAQCLISRINPAIISFAVMAFVIMACVISPASAAGDENAAGLLRAIIRILGGIAAVAGIIMGVLGLIAYAEAKSEGEGPAMAKAKNQLIASVMVIVVGSALTIGAGTLAGLMGSVTVDTSTQ